jgi:uncharacterized protein YdaU (DUF1376 family)
MAALPYMQLYVADYLADTAHLTTAEHGAYLLLLFNYWQRGESFKAKDERTLNGRLASVARMSNEEFAVVKETISEFFEISENEWFHCRIERDLEAVNSKSAKASNAGKLSAQRRAEKKAVDIEGNSNGRSTDVQRTNERSFNHTDTDTNTDTDKYKPIDRNSAQIVPIAQPKPEPRTSALDGEFSEFWKRYPKKVGKDKALQAWKKKKPRIDDVMFALSWQIASDQWTKEEGKYIPNPTTYINEGRWKDEPPQNGRDDFIPNNARGFV